MPARVRVLTDSGYRTGDYLRQENLKIIVRVDGGAIGSFGCSDVAVLLSDPANAIPNNCWRCLEWWAMLKAGELCPNCFKQVGPSG